jgi:hypothetical protein
LVHDEFDLGNEMQEFQYQRMTKTKLLLDSKRLDKIQTVTLNSWKFEVLWFIFQVVEKLTVISFGKAARLC